MYVCLCRRVSDRKVRKAIGRGANTVDDIAAACGAGTGCGGCHPQLRSMLCELGADGADPVCAPVRATLGADMADSPTLVGVAAARH